MRIDVSGWVGILGLIFTIIVVLTAALALARANAANSTVTALRGDRDDLITRLSLANDKIVTQAGIMELMRLDLQKSNEKIAIIERLASGKEQLDHLQVQLDTHDKRVDEHHRVLIATIIDLLDATRKSKVS